MTRQEMIARIVAGQGRKPRAPAQPRALCPHCGKKGLGNTFVGKFADGDHAYRDCVYCDEKVRV